MWHLSNLTLFELKSKKQKHFSYGNKLSNKWLTQIRLGRSFLNQHKFTIGLSDSPSCLCDRIESSEHFLLHCFLYTEERKTLFSSVQNMFPKFSTFPDKRKFETLLFGVNLDSDEPDCRNKRIMKLVQEFIMKTKRFDIT